MVFEKCLKFFIILLVNFKIVLGQSHVPLTAAGTCPPNYELRNDLCYQVPNRNTPTCPPEYFLYIDGLCYPKERKPCPAEVKKSEENSMTTTNIPPQTTPYPAEIKRYSCPKGSIMYRNKCRKVVCPLGEYYRGACHRPICPLGLVWRGKQCQKPGFVTTLIEIDNTFVNQVNEKPFALEINEHDEINNHTTTVMPAVTTNPQTFSKIQETTVANTQQLPMTSTTKSYEEINNLKTNATCCQIITPRICKRYVRWHCFNRKYTICDNRICTTPVLYLEAPETKYEPPILVMPPKPHLNVYNGFIVKNYYFLKISQIVPDVMKVLRKNVLHIAIGMSVRIISPVCLCC